MVERDKREGRKEVREADEDRGHSDCVWGDTEAFAVEQVLEGICEGGGSWVLRR